MNHDRMDEYRQYAGVASTIGVDVEFPTPAEVKEIWPQFVPHAPRGVAGDARMTV